MITFKESIHALLAFDKLRINPLIVSNQMIRVDYKADLVSPEGIKNRQILLSGMSFIFCIAFLIIYFPMGFVFLCCYCSYTYWLVFFFFEEEDRLEFIVFWYLL